MRRFIKRLDKYIDAVIDLDSIWSAQAIAKPVPVKAIFDNLRYFTTLAFMWVGVRLLRDAGYQVASWIFGVCVYALGLLVVMQFVALLMAVTLSTVTNLLPPRTAVRIRKAMRSHSTAVKIAQLVLTVPMIVFTLLIGASLIQALAKANLL